MFSTRFSSSTLLTGLLEKIVGAGIDGPFDVAQFVQRGNHQDHDRARGRIVLELLANLEAAQLGHHHVQENQIGLEAGHFVERVAAIDGDGDIAIDAGQKGFEQFDIGRIVVGDKDSALAFRIEFT